MYRTKYFKDSSCQSRRETGKWDKVIDEADILLRKDQENGQVHEIAVGRNDEKLEPCEIESGKENKVR